METEIVWFAVAIFTALGMPMIQIDDQRGPYSDISQCYHRGSVMLKQIIAEGKFPPIVQFQVLCVDNRRRPIEKGA